MWQKLCHFNKYSIWRHLGVFQTVPTHAQQLFYKHQHCQVHPKCQKYLYYSTGNSVLTG